MRRKHKIPQFEFGYSNEPFALVGEREALPEEPKPKTPPQPEPQEEFFGGAFDGFTVTSDADPGL
jgi:hypothetical protein